MKLRTFRKKEEGAVAVIVALSMTVLLGFVAIAVDFGMMAECKGELQNAADAAALAAAADLGTGSTMAKIEETAKHYCSANGYDPEENDVTMTVQTVNGNSLCVTLTREMKMGFSSVLTGQRTQEVSASATAEVVRIFGDCPYAIFADKKGIYETGIGVYGNDHPKVVGSIHSNSGISFADVTVEGGSVTACGDIQPQIEDGLPFDEEKPMPSLEYVEKAINQMPCIAVFQGDYIQNGTSCFSELIKDAEAKVGANPGHLVIYIKGKLEFNGYNPAECRRDYPITLIVENDVSLNGAPLQGNMDKPVYVISKNGNITMSGGALDFFGILYAPNGEVSFNGIDVNFTGSIIAQRFNKGGGKFNITYDKEINRFLPKSKVHLIA